MPRNSKEERKSKAKAEYEFLKKVNRVNDKLDFYDKETEDLYMALWRRVHNRSGDWYNDKFVRNSNAEYEQAKYIIKKHNNKKLDPNYDYHKDYSSRFDFYDNLVGATLLDIGFENNKRNSKLIRDTVIWD